MIKLIRNLLASIFVASILFWSAEAWAAQTCTWQGDSGADTNWGTANNWHGSVTDHTVPVAGDAVVFSNAVNCTIATTAACASIDCTGYTGTLTQNANMTTTGNVTLVSGMTFTYSSGTWNQTGNGTITSGTKAFGAFTTNGANIVMTLADDMTVNGAFSQLGGASVGNQITGAYNLNLKGDVTITAYCLRGTTNMIVNGSGNQALATTAQINYATGNNIDIASTGGTVTFSNATHYIGRNLTWTSGTVAFGTSTIYLGLSNGGSGVTRNLGGFNAVAMNNLTLNTNSTVTLDANLNVDGTLTHAVNNPTVLNGNSLYASGSVTVNAALSGTTTLIMDGTGTWSAGSSAGTLADNTTINTAGTITIGANVYYKTGTLTYTAGTIDVATNSTVLNIPLACTLTTNGMTWYAIDFAANLTLTLGSNLTFTNNWNAGNKNVTLSGNYALIAAGTSTMKAGTGLAMYNFTILDGATVHLTSTHTFTVSGTFTANGSAGITLDSTTPDSQAVLTVTTAGTVNKVTATDINSGGGSQIIDTGGTLDNATNWVVPGTVPKINGVASANISKVNGISAANIEKVNGIGT